MLPQEFTVGWKEFARTTPSLCMWLVTLIEGKLSQAACAFLFLLLTQTHRKISTGLQEQIKAWLEFGIGNSTHTTKLPSLGLSGVGELEEGKGVSGTQSMDRSLPKQRPHPSTHWNATSGEQMALLKSIQRIIGLSCTLNGTRQDTAKSAEW